MLLDLDEARFPLQMDAHIRLSVSRPTHSAKLESRRAKRAARRAEDIIINANRMDSTFIDSFFLFDVRLFYCRLVRCTIRTLASRAPHSTLSIRTSTRACNLRREPAAFVGFYTRAARPASTQKRTQTTTERPWRRTASCHTHAAR